MNQPLLSEKKVQLAPLKDVLAYSNPHIVPKFMENWDVEEDVATDLFEEMKKWLWISAKSIIQESNGEEVPKLAVSFSMTLLDEMWHTFILFTKDYQLFCKRYFGFYINHAPTTKEEKDRNLAEFEQDPDAFRAKVEARTAVQYSYVYDHLGAETLRKWYSDWTDTFTPDYLDQIRKSPWKN